MLAMMFMNNNVTWSSNTPYGGMVQDGMFYNLDMANYVSGNTWPDASGYGRNFTFYTGSGTGTPWTTTANVVNIGTSTCLLYTSPSPRDGLLSRMPSSA